MGSMPIKRNGMVFITGTDTDSGKTLLTAMLVAHLRNQGVNALAMKPFCSGGTEDLEVLSAMQGQVLSRGELNPFYFSEPLAPSIAAKKSGRRIILNDVFRRIAAVKAKCDILLIEGSGGVMVPLGENFLVVDLIRKLNCPVIIAGRNRLGIINHAALTLLALETNELKEISVALMGVKRGDPSANFNARAIRSMFGGCVVEIPFLPSGCCTTERAKKSFRKFQKTLARLLEFDTLHVRSLRVGPRQKTVDRKKFKKSVDGSSR